MNFSEKINEGDNKMKICITGTLSKGRKEFEKLINDAGHEFVNRISNDLDYLVVGEKAGSKLQKAKDKGIKIISEMELEGVLK